MKKNKLSTYFLTFSIFTFAATFFYIAHNSYDSLMRPINEVKQSVIIKPINPNLDIATLDEIEKRNATDILVTPTVFDVVSPESTSEGEVEIFP